MEGSKRKMLYSPMPPFMTSQARMKGEKRKLRERGGKGQEVRAAMQCGCGCGVSG